MAQYCLSGQFPMYDSSIFSGIPMPDFAGMTFSVPCLPWPPVPGCTSVLDKSLATGGLFSAALLERLSVFVEFFKTSSIPLPPQYTTIHGIEISEFLVAPPSPTFMQTLSSLTAANPLVSVRQPLFASVDFPAFSSIAEIQVMVQEAVYFSVTGILNTINSIKSQVESLAGGINVGFDINSLLVDISFNTLTQAGFSAYGVSTYEQFMNKIKTNHDNVLTLLPSFTFPALDSFGFVPPVPEMELMDAPEFSFSEMMKNYVGSAAMVILKKLFEAWSIIAGVATSVKIGDYYISEIFGGSWNLVVPSSPVCVSG